MPCLPRTPGEGISQAVVGTAFIITQRRSERTPQDSISNLWTSASKYHHSPCCRPVPACQSLLKACIDRSASLSVHLLKQVSWRRAFCLCSYGFCPCNTVYSILKVLEGDGKTHLSPIIKKRGVCHRFPPPSWKSRNIFQLGTDRPGCTRF